MMKLTESSAKGYSTHWQTCLLNLPLWVWAIVTIGVLLRIRQFLCGRSLWNDEAELALNILHRTFGGLLRPLDYHQGAPIGFLLMEKLATVPLGKSELALRAIPFVAGIAALFLFYDVAKQYLIPGAVPLALSLFALSKSVVYYSSEAKQYSTDVLCTLILLGAVFRLSRPTLSQRELLGIGALGVLMIWVSHPASFMLSGAAVSLLVVNLARRRQQEFSRMFWVFAAWAVSFGICYVVSLRSLSHDNSLLGYWEGNLAPHRSSLFVSWVSNSFFAAFENPAPLNSILGAAFFVAGCAQLLRRDKLRLSFLIAPLLALLLASLLHRYPLYGRLLSFLCPILLLVVSEGAIWAFNVARRLSPALGIVLIVLLLAKPAYLAVNALVHPIRPEDIKIAIRYIQSHQQPGERWYAYYGAKYQLSYYAEVDNLPMANVYIGADCGTDAACYAEDLGGFRGSRRLWVLLSHILPHDDTDEGMVLSDQLDRLGTRVTAVDKTGVKVYLCDLSPASTSTK